MNKQRTHKSTSKRFKLTAGGKVLHRHHYLRHKRKKHSKSTIREKKLMVAVVGVFEKKIKRLLGVK